MESLATSMTCLFDLDLKGLKGGSIDLACLSRLLQQTRWKVKTDKIAAKL